jgi:alginate O-acetyltransferase complex protein AlgI
MSVASWLASRAIARASGGRRALTGLTVAALLAVLAFYKYADLFVRTFTPSHGGFGIALPLGVSFYTFEMICYVVDVHRGAQPAQGLVGFLVYIAYFPHLVAGPIVRPHELLPQLAEDRPFSSEVFSEGVSTALAGLVVKLVFADNLAVTANAVFAAPAAWGPLGAWLGVAAYSGQILCDFWGYTSIARGCSLALGYALPPNFDHPYASASPTEFWRRWHMTLSRWLRDYLYVPLGGGRGGRLATYRNLLVTMALGGLWHGARWTFVLWGVYHGLLLVAHKAWSDLARRSPALERARRTSAYRAAAVAFTLLAVMIGWIPFRAPSLADAGTLLRRVTFAAEGAAAGTVPGAARSLALLAALAAITAAGAYDLAPRLHRALSAQWRGFVWAVLAAAVYLLGTSTSEFIYFYF